MKESHEHREVVVPEVLPPGSDQPAAAEVVASVRWQRLKQALIAGLLLDVVDIYSIIPTPPMALGRAVVGALVGWYACRTQQVPAHQRVWWISLSALYCAIPRTFLFPLATLVLVYRALRKP
jgi:hypothetical protein